MIRSSRRSNAITNKIKTYFTTYIGEIPATGAVTVKARRVSENNVVGTAEEITSDVKLPESRIPSTPEIGTASNSGDVSTEWNIDEQDDLFEGVFCNSWDETGWGTTTGTKTLTLGNAVKSYLLLKKYPQQPVAHQLYTKEYINQLTMDFATDAFVKLTWNLMGSNNPQKDTSGNVPTYDTRTVTPATGWSTKSFLTKKGWLKYGAVTDSVSNLTQIRQSPSLNITINNNMERTPALFEEESIENSLGDFVIEGSFDVYNVDALGHQIYNDAVNGEDRKLSVKVERTIGTVTTSYELTMRVHLKAPTESKNGNKLQFSVGFQVNSADDLLLTKTVTDSSSNSVSDSEEG